jgi:hypothetical protein
VARRSQNVSIIPSMTVGVPYLNRDKAQHFQQNPDSHGGDITVTISLRQTTSRCGSRLRTAPR